METEKTTNPKQVAEESEQEQEGRLIRVIRRLTQPMRAAGGDKHAAKRFVRSLAASDAMIVLQLAATAGEAVIRKLDASNTFPAPAAKMPPSGPSPAEAGVADMVTVKDCAQCPEFDEYNGEGEPGDYSERKPENCGKWLCNNWTCPAEQQQLEIMQQCKQGTQRCSECRKMCKMSCGDNEQRLREKRAAAGSAGVSEPPNHYPG